MNDLRYLHLDVFTGTPLAGNQLAVFPDAVGLSSETMQQIANEMAFPETTFVLPAATPEAAARVRIFTPHTELPMAGHPTVGTTFALAHEGRIPAATSEIVLELGIGPTPVGLEWDATALRFAWMTQPNPEFGSALFDRRRMAQALGVDVDDLVGELPIQEVSSGVPFLFVALRRRRSVDAAVLDRTRLIEACREAGREELPVFIFSLEPTADGATAYSRMFAPGFGIAEDPATGGASGPLGAYLFRHGAVEADAARHMVSLQGVAMKRPSRIHIAVASLNERITSLRVGGEAMLVATGTLIAH